MRKGVPKGSGARREVKKPACADHSETGYCTVGGRSEGGSQYDGDAKRWVNDAHFHAHHDAR